MIHKYKRIFLFIALTGGVTFAKGQVKSSASHANWTSTTPQPSASWVPTDTDFCYLNFIENKGQWNNKVIYQSDFRGGRLFLERNALTYVFYPPGGVDRFHPHAGGLTDTIGNTLTFQAIRMDFLNSTTNPTIEPAEQKNFYCNYFLGNDPKQWASKAQVYGKIYYSQLYPGITAKVFSDRNDVRYDFVIAPHTSPAEIKLKFEGQNGLALKDGKLVIKTEIGDIEEATPTAYQMIEGKKVKVACRYVLQDNQVGFRIIDKYDISQALIIDPTLVFATYTGSTADNWGMSATYDAAGDGYTSGICFGVGYPVTLGAFQQTFQGGGMGGGNNWGWPDNNGFDIVVSKFNPTGTTLLFSTYLGGSDNEEPSSLVVDNNNDLIILGRTYSTNYPTTNGAYSRNLSGGADIVLTKFDSNGTQLLASTYIGGASDDGVNTTSLEGVRGGLKYNYSDDDRGDVVVDNNNNIYVASCTISNNFPTTAGAYRTTPYGNQDGVVFKFNSGLSTLMWSTYIGGSDSDAAYNIVLNSHGDVYVTGGTTSNNFPTTPGVIKPNYGGNTDGFLCHFSANGAALLNSTYIGTAAYDQSYLVQTDKYDNVYVYGQSEGAYPVTGGVYSNPNSGQFIHELNPTLTSTIFSTVFGSGRGTPDISPSAFLVDNCQNIYVAGWGGPLFGYNVRTSSTNGLPVTANAFQSITSGNDFYFMVLQSGASALWYATYFGGAQSLQHVDGGTSRFDKNGVIYQAICEGCGGVSDMPTSPGAWSATNNSPNCNNAIVKFQMDLLHTVASFVINPSVTAGCAPFSVTFGNTSNDGKEYKWYFGDGDSSNVVAPTHVYNTPGSYRIMMVAIDSATCNIRDTAYASVRVVPPLVMNPIPNTFICFGDSVNLNAVSPGASSFAWSPTLGLNSTVINNPDASPAITTKYIVTARDSFCAANDTVTVQVVHNTAKIEPANPQLCLGSSVALSSDSVDPVYSWSTGQTTSSVQVTAGGEYYLHTTDTHGCRALDSVNVKTFTKAPLLLNDTTICTGHQAFLHADSGGYTYQWTPPGSLNQSNSFKATASPSVTTVYTLTITNGPCISLDSEIVTVHPSPSIKAVPDSVMIAGGQSVTLNAVGDPGWIWSPSYRLSCDNCPYPVVTPDSNTIYYVKVTNSYGCSASDSMIIDILPTFYIPDAFTPNGDGKNDIFQPKFRGYVSIDAYIFNRWGQLLYHWNTLNGGWDGTFQGSYVQQDVYVYMIKATSYTNSVLQKTGSVTLIR